MGTRPLNSELLLVDVDMSLEIISGDVLGPTRLPFNITHFSGHQEFMLSEARVFPK